MPEAAFRVSGRVQGVGFRWWTRLQARQLDLMGTVRNAADGSVEVQARGEAAALDELRRRLSSGPPGAHVDAVEAIGVDLRSAEEGFQILR
ncbi:MAG TPA: acylphosphatase [Longimicrobium sp.]|nr:acylphosphatase [Longimicrobium sp.]